MMKKGADKKGLLILLIFLVGSAAATTMVYRMVAGPSSKRSKAQMSQFGEYLKDKKFQDSLDDDETPDEIRRAQMASGSGQFSDANYGQGSLGFVKGSKPGSGDGKGGDGSGDGSGSGGAGGKDGKGGSGSGSAKGAMKGKLGEMAKSKFGSSGASGYSFGGASGSGSGTGSKSGSSSSASSGSSGSQTGKSATSAKTGTISARSSSSKGRRGAIGDLAKRSSVAYGAGSQGASYAAAGLDQAMAGKGSGVDVGGANAAGSGIYESDLASSEGSGSSSSADTPVATESTSTDPKCPGDFCWGVAVTHDEPDQSMLQFWAEESKQATSGDYANGWTSTWNEYGNVYAELWSGDAFGGVPVLEQVLAAIYTVIWAVLGTILMFFVALFSGFDKIYTSRVVIAKDDVVIASPIMPWYANNVDVAAIKDMSSVKQIATMPYKGLYLLWYEVKVGGPDQDKHKLSLKDSDGTERTGCVVLFDYDKFVDKYNEKAEKTMTLAYFENGQSGDDSGADKEGIAYLGDDITKGLFAPVPSDAFTCIKDIKELMKCCQQLYNNYNDASADTSSCSSKITMGDSDYDALKSAMDSNGGSLETACIDHFGLMDQVESCDFE